MRSVALSGDWVKLVDDYLTESPFQGSSHTVNAQKRGPGGRRNRKQTSASEAEADDRLERSFTWWRGGKLSKLLFNRAMLPSSVVKKAARQGHFSLYILSVISLQTFLHSLPFLCNDGI